MIKRNLTITVDPSSRIAQIWLTSGLSRKYLVLLQSESENAKMKISYILHLGKENMIWDPVNVENTLNADKSHIGSPRSANRDGKTTLTSSSNSNGETRPIVPIIPGGSFAFAKWKVTVGAPMIPRPNTQSVWIAPKHQSSQSL